MCAVLTGESAGRCSTKRRELDAVLARAGALTGHHGAGFESLNAHRSDLHQGSRERAGRRKGKEDGREGGPGGQTGRERATGHQARASEGTAGSGERRARGDGRRATGDGRRATGEGRRARGWSPGPTMHRASRGDIVMTIVGLSLLVGLIGMAITLDRVGWIRRMQGRVECKPS